MCASPAATAVAHPNIAFIKYWGNLDDRLRLPASPSFSMTLGGLTTTTSVRLDRTSDLDQANLNGRPVNGPALARISAHLDLVRQAAQRTEKAQVVSSNDFPTGSGVASSASGFAALTLAACAAYGLALPPEELSRVARRGSGSACRSIFGGFVEWPSTGDDSTCHAHPVAPADHWPLIDWVAVVDQGPKPVGSTQGHQLAGTSPLQAARLASATQRLAAAKQSVLERDFEALAIVAELDSDLMHAVMMTSSPPILYWRPATLAVIHTVRRLRQSGTPVFYTLDAGPNPHCLCTQQASDTVKQALEQVPGVERLLRATGGGPARLVSDEPRQAE